MCKTILPFASGQLDVDSGGGDWIVIAGLGSEFLSESSTQAYA